MCPWATFARQIGGDLVQVQVLIPPGASPHAFEPPPSVMARASQARVFVYIGAGMEPWADKLLRSRGRDGLVVVEAAQGVPLLKDTHQHHHEEAEKPGHTGQHHEEEESADLHQGGNPHIWLDPVLAQDICRKIASAFIQADPGHRAQYEANLKNYLAALDELNREIEQPGPDLASPGFCLLPPVFLLFRPAVQSP